jgi:hypothetical protein
VDAGVGTGVVLGRVLATGKGTDPLEHPARSIATNIAHAPSQLVIYRAIVALCLL